MFLALSGGLAGGAAAEENPVVVLTTSLGEIEIELYADKAPKSVENFLAYVDDGFYDGTVFHRVIPNFMIQGGGMSADMSRKPTKAPIENEADNGLDERRRDPRPGPNPGQGQRHVPVLHQRRRTTTSSTTAPETSGTPSSAAWSTGWTS